RQLRVEAGADDVALPDQHRLAADALQHLDARPDLDDARRADEDAPRVLEAVELPAPGVARDRDVEPAEARLRRLDGAGGEDQAGAGRERRQAARGGERPPQAVAREQAQHDRALAAGEDQTVEPGEVGGGADQADVLAAERTHVRVEAALEREDADHLAASLASTGSLAASSPRIAAPRPAETCASLTGSCQ